MPNITKANNYHSATMRVMICINSGLGMFSRSIK
jgi:hypothetical protein